MLQLIYLLNVKEIVIIGYFLDEVRTTASFKSYNNVWDRLWLSYNRQLRERHQHVTRRHVVPQEERPHPPLRWTRCLSVVASVSGGSAEPTKEGTASDTAPLWRHWPAAAVEVREVQSRIWTACEGWNKYISRQRGKWLPAVFNENTFELKKLRSVIFE